MKPESLKSILLELSVGKIDSISCDSTHANWRKIVSVLGIDEIRRMPIEFDAHNVAYVHSYPSLFGDFKIECFGLHRNSVAPIYVQRIF